MPPAFIELGARKIEHAIRLWRECMASGKWPGYPNRIHWAEPPAWAQAQWDEVEMAHGIEYDPGKMWGKPVKELA
jgi:hypothetical protein